MGKISHLPVVLALRDAVLCKSLESLHISLCFVRKMGNKCSNLLAYFKTNVEFVQF